jgi:hypothetical protein
MENKHLLKQLSNELYNLVDAITENNQEEIHQTRANIKEILSDESMSLILP